jgi:serine/threonine protein kinase
MDDLSPEITKKYEVLEKMGEGGMGAVYKVRHRRIGTFHVIKVIRASLQGSGDLGERFIREATTAMQLRHPNLVEVTDYHVTDDGTAYIVMEFIKGVNLGEALARAHGPLDYRFVVNIAQQALAALGYMHRKKKVHRDISPDNFILARDDDGNPHIKLIDLGISKSAEQQTLTKSNAFIGKVSYAPPEQFGGDSDARSDLYAFGVMLYELLTNSRPIVGANPLAVMASHVRDLPRPFAASDPSNRVPENVRAIVMKALEKDRSARWQTAQEFAAALQTCESPLLEKTIEVTIPYLLSNDAALRQEEQEEWDEAKAADSIAGWERYLDRNPATPRAVRARLFLDASKHGRRRTGSRPLISTRSRHGASSPAITVTLLAFGKRTRVWRGWSELGPRSRLGSRPLPSTR